MRSRRGSWNVDRGMRREECGMGRKSGKIHCHCQNKFSFWNPLKISFEAKLLEKCKRRTKKLNKNTKKNTKNWQRRRRSSREGKKSKEERRGEQKRGDAELSKAAEKTGKNWKYYKTFVIISVAFIVGASLLSLSFSLPSPARRPQHSTLASCSPSIRQFSNCSKAAKKLNFFRPIAINAARRVCVDLRTNPNRNPTHNTTQHTQQQYTVQHKQGTHTGTNRSTNTWLPAQLLRQQNLNPTLLYPDHINTYIAMCAMNVCRYWNCLKVMG